MTRGQAHHRAGIRALHYRIGKAPMHRSAYRMTALILSKRLEQQIRTPLAFPPSYGTYNKPANRYPLEPIPVLPRSRYAGGEFPQLHRHGSAVRLPLCTPGHRPIHAAYGAGAPAGLPAGTPPREPKSGDRYRRTVDGEPFDNIPAFVIGSGSHRRRNECCAGYSRIARPVVVIQTRVRSTSPLRYRIRPRSARVAKA